MTQQNKALYLESKPRYEILDGLRGVAALAVVMFHMMEPYPSEVSRWIFPHGFLSVDFFFALSGFVLAYAYDDRWGNMTMWSFFKRRIVRLHPLVLLGVVFGLCLFYYSGSTPVFGNVDSTPWWLLLLEGLALFFMIPISPKYDIRGWGELTGINGPIWSLMFEYVANLFYALFIRRIGKVVLAILVLACGVMTADLCLNLNLWGNLSDDRFFCSMNGGCFFTPEHLYRGYVRLLFPFLMGMLLARCGRFMHIRGSFCVASLLVLVIVAMPWIGDNNLGEGLFQLISIIAVFPIILSIGAGGVLKGKFTEKLCIFLGRISFPLYITHYPLFYMHMSWAQRHMDAPISTHIFVGIATLLMAIGVAWCALKLYDEPVREWLKEHWLKRSAK